MEISSIHGFSIEQGVLTLEKVAQTRKSENQLKIGIPKETTSEERRVAVTPEGVETLINAGHMVFVEKGAGETSRFGDDLYVLAGAHIAASASDLYAQAELIAKMFPPTGAELSLLQDRQILISALHLGSATAELIQKLMALRITAIGFEFIRDTDGTFPIVRMMHEITGALSIQLATRFLESTSGGRGLILGGISGIPPATVVILGSGIIGEWAARAALGYGANVMVLDTELGPLRQIEHFLSRNVTTAMANPQYLRRAIRSADVVIGAKMKHGQRSPVLITEDMIAEMRPGSVVIDLMMDQGGCIETSRPTTLSQPTFVQHGVIHCCIPNLPSAVSRTSSIALSNVLVPYLLEIGEQGSINNALWYNPSLRNGTYVYRSHLTKKSLAAMFNMPHRDIELLIASGI